MALAWRANAESILMNLDVAFALLDEAIAIGRQADRTAVVAHALTWRMWALFFAGRMHEVVQSAEELAPLIEALDDDRYVVLKSRSAVAFAHGVLGEIDETRRVADELEELGERTGSARALSMAHSVRTCLAMFAGDWDRGVAEGTAAIRVVRDPVYHAIASATVVSLLAQAGRVDALRAALDAVSHGDDMMGEIHRWAEGICLVLEGKLSQGMRVLEHSRQRGVDTGAEWAVVVTDLYIAAAYARIVTRETTAPVSAVLRNPGFVLRHAAPARRKARRAFETFEHDHLEGKGLEGLRPAFEYERAKFLAHEGDRDGAKRSAERALATSASYGDSEGRRDIKALLDRLA